MPATHAPTVVIENFYPCLEGGRHPVKRVIGEPLDVWCDIFKDGHDVMSAVLRWRLAGSKRWSEAPMKLESNDRWHASCAFEKAGRWEYLVEAWGDTFRSWKKTFAVRVGAKDPDVPIEAREGARLLSEAAGRAKKAGATAAASQMQECADLLTKVPAQDILDVLQSDEMQALMDQFPDRELSTHSTTMQVIVERERARFSAWYEFCPRGAEGLANKHSTFRDCLGRLDHAAHLGFDVIYFPPIHPIGITARKGKNNTLTALEGDEEIARAFEEGADDFLHKPFRNAELVARIRAILRRAEHAKATPDTARVGECEINLAGHTLVRRGKESALTFYEVELLKLLAERVEQRAQVVPALRAQQLRQVAHVARHAGQGPDPHRRG